jgi:hypothetical protein
MTEAEVEAAAKAKAEAAEAEAIANAAADSPKSEATEGTEKVAEAELVTPTITEDATASTEAQPKVELSEEDQKKLRQLMLDLRWLITEGYVTEYGDGRLFAPPPMPDAKPKEPKATKLESGIEADPETEAKEEVVAETEVVKGAEELNIQASPEIVAAEDEEPKLEAQVNEAEIEEPTEENKS